jgi:hypothetical protein
MHATDWLSFIVLSAATLILLVFFSKIKIKTTNLLSEWLKIAAIFTFFLTLHLALRFWGEFGSLQLVVVFLIGFPAALLLYAASRILEILTNRNTNNIIN